MASFHEARAGGRVGIKVKDPAEKKTSPRSFKIQSERWRQLRNHKHKKVKERK